MIKPTQGKKSTDQRIRKVMREVEKIHSFAHPLDDKDADINLFNAKSLREDAVRMTVLQMSLAIESILDGLFARAFLGHSPSARRGRIGRRGKELQELLEGGRFGFESKLRLARILGLITKRQRSALERLNALRNKCAHRWTLDVVRRKGKKPRPTTRLLEFEGKNLLDLDVLEGFMHVYSGIYLKMFLKYTS